MHHYYKICCTFQSFGVGYVAPQLSLAHELDVVREASSGPALDLLSETVTGPVIHPPVGSCQSCQGRCDDDFPSRFNLNTVAFDNL